METARTLLNQLSMPSGDLYDMPSSPKRFPDEAQYRVEIPSVEGVEALQAVIEAAQDALDLRISKEHTPNSGVPILNHTAKTL